MSRALKSALIAFGVSLFCFLSLSSWYWIQFRQPPLEQLRSLKRALPVLEQLLQQHEESKAASLVDKFPFQIIVTNPSRHVLISNLGTSLQDRLQIGQQALKKGFGSGPILSDSGMTQLYYQLPPQWLDMHLLFPLIFSLLLGMIAALWDFLSGMNQVNQTDALLMFSQMPGLHHHEASPSEEDTPALEEKIKNLEQKNKSLQAALKEAKQWVLAAPADEAKVLQVQVNTLEAQLLAQQHKYDQSQQHDKLLKTQKQDLESKLAVVQVQLEQQQSEVNAHKQQHKQDQGEITRLHQDLQRVTRDHESQQQRMHELEKQAAQLHEAWQEISQLRTTQTEFLQKEEAWRKEKQKVLALLHERDQQIDQFKDRLKQTRQKIHELSLAYKKQLEMSVNLPEDMQAMQSILAGLIDEKDQIEHENVDLQIELADRNSEVSRLRKELEVRADRLQEAQKMIEDLAEHLHKNERELSLLGETLEDKLLDLDRIKDLHNEDQQVLEATSQERDQLRLRLADLQTELETLREEKSHLIYAKDLLEQQLEHIDIEAYQLEIDQLRQSLQLMTQQQHRRSQTIEDLQKKIKESDTLYQKLKRYAETQDKEVRNLQQEITMYHSEINLLRDKLNQQNPDNISLLKEDRSRY